MLKKLSVLLITLAVAVLGALAFAHTSAAGVNLIANPSVETSNGASPDSWTAAKTGNNTTNFNYLNTGHSGRLG